MHEQMNVNSDLDVVLKKYAAHPEFIGIEIADVNQVGAVDNTVLHLAAGKGEVADITILVAGGADLNRKGDLGHTPLHFAALMGRVDAARELLRLGAKCDEMNEFQQSPLDVAKLGGRKEIAQLLEAAMKKRRT